MLLFCLAGFLDLMGAVCAVGMLVTLVRSLRIWQGGAVTQGVVIGHETEDAGVTLVVSYCVQGVAYQVRSSLSEDKNLFPIGTIQAVRYLPRAPSQAGLLGRGDLFATPIALAVAAVAMGGLGTSLTVALSWF